MIEGRVKTWDALKGWGFLEDEDGYDYFVNSTSVRTGHKLKTGDRVRFDVRQGQRGPAAENVMKIVK